MKSRTSLTQRAGTDVADGAIAGIRARFLGDFDAAYVDNVIVPFFTAGNYRGERPTLPMIDVLYTKENAIAPQLWGLFSDDWRKPAPEEGSSVFLQGLDKRGPGNLRKKMYISAITSDLYESMYAEKVRGFFARLLDDTNAGQPLMHRYLDSYFNLYWDLHLGVTGAAIPSEVRQIGHSFSAVLAYRDPTLTAFYQNYMIVRQHREFLKRWIDERVSDLLDGRTAEPEKTFVNYWIKNRGSGDYFRREDLVFECFHNFVAFTQWGSALYGFMTMLRRDGHPSARAWFEQTMHSNFDAPSPECAFTPLERLVMELFRTISPNPGSISVIESNRPAVDERDYSVVITPHLATSSDPRHWDDPVAFNPDRYLGQPTSDQIDEAHCKQIGLARRPFEAAPFEVNDGRHATLTSSGFGTVYGVVDDKPLPVCDHAGYAPFGFGYRRCPAERFTICVFSDFLKAVWQRGIQFEQLEIGEPAELPIGLGTLIADNIGFKRPQTS